MKHILNEFDHSATDVGNRYKTFAASLTDRGHRGMLGSNAFSAMQGKMLKRDLVNMAVTMLENEEVRISIEMETLTESALRAAIDHLRMTDAETNEVALRTSLEASERDAVNFLYSEIAAQVNRDVNQTIKDFRNACLRVVMKVDTSSLTTSQAKEKVVMEEMSSERLLKYTDAAGRKVNSDAHIRRTWRAAMRDHWVQTYLRTLSHMGETHAIVWHPDVASDSFGRAIDIAEPEYGLKDFKKVFHPNARSIPVSVNHMEMIT